MVFELVVFWEMSEHLESLNLTQLFETAQVVNASKNRIWFAYVDDYLKVPEFITEDPSRKAAIDEIKWSLGYRGMCRFRSGTIFLQPVLKNLDLTGVPLGACLSPFWFLFEI